jgi:choline dehydrogenase
VDSRARVMGTRGLRVVDASSFALLPPGHPQSMVCKFFFSFLFFSVAF